MSKRVAVLFFGLTRSLRNIHNNLKENLFNELQIMVMYMTHLYIHIVLKILI